MPGLLSEDLAASMANAPDFLDSLLLQQQQQQQHKQYDSFSLDAPSSHSAYLGLNAMPPCDADILLGAGRPGLRLDLKELAAMGALGGGGAGGCDSPLAGASMGSLHRFLPSNNEDTSAAQHVYSSDEFRMFEFKVRRCMRGRSHDWTECPFAHPGEKARRRDPRRFHYSGTACPDFRKGLCRSGDACELAHGVFECWLHPARYRTQPCKDGRACKRRVCFFAHTPEQLRVAPSSSPPPPSSPSAFEQLLIHKQSLEQMLQQQQYERSCYESLFSKSQHQMSSSPTSTLHSPPPMSPPLSPGSPESPPMSPCSSPPLLEQQYAAAAAAAAMLRSRQAELQAAALLSSPPSRRQLERIKSMPSAAAVAAAANQRRRLAAYTSSASFNGRPNNGMSNLVAALRSIDLGGYPSPAAGYSVHPQSPPMSPSSWISHSPLRGPLEFGRFEQQQQQQQQQQAGWGGGLDQHQFECQGTETGPDLRSKVYSNKTGGENLPECGECPDLGWVTDLVADQ